MAFNRLRKSGHKHRASLVFREARAVQMASITFLCQPHLKFYFHRLAIQRPIALRPSRVCREDRAAPHTSAPCHLDDYPSRRSDKSPFDPVIRSLRRRFLPLNRLSLKCRLVSEGCIDDLARFVGQEHCRGVNRNGAHFATRQRSHRKRLFRSIFRANHGPFLSNRQGLRQLSADNSMPGALSSQMIVHDHVVVIDRKFEAITLVQPRESFLDRFFA